MTAYVTITVEEKPDVLKLQNTAFQFRPVVAGTVSGKKSNVERQKIIQERKSLKPNEAMVYVLKDKSPVSRKVKKGISNLLETEILEGLSTEDTVILEDLTTKVTIKHGGP